MKRDSNQHNESPAQWPRRILLIGGSLFALVGLARQWPIAGKSYMEFIEGDGYLSLILGLVMIVLGFSAHLLIGLEDR
ncbi:MAG: hypothetical protein G3M78_14700 [Candidatus Nitrohelix vancouverensis]|uniref:Uncharacterized protein n=1 Tax=Candidatus Nitrohelix vancouverensis TaxID=2705534 RepID=A0A7T0C4Y0_9BACT|nr:MAG: hypothetical protein G3M78_14700 [Candidatus Nitrohelix vancouverensis]